MLGMGDEVAGIRMMLSRICHGRHGTILLVLE